MTNKKTKVRFDPFVEDNAGEVNESEIEQRQQEVDHLKETVKVMQTQINDLGYERDKLEKQISDAQVARKATQQDFERLKEKANELEEALRKSLQKDGFVSASQLPRDESTPAQIWLPADDAVLLFVHLRKARDTAIANWQQKRRILIDFDKDGRVKGAHLADV